MAVAAEPALGWWLREQREPRALGSQSLRTAARLWCSCLALLILNVAITAASAQEPGETQQRAIHAKAAPAPLYTPEDLLFLSHMIVHHEQALELAALVPSRTAREEFIRFARYIDGAQRTEIAHMQALLRLAADRGMEITHHPMTGDPPMSGMLSKAEMAALAQASGAEFERLWLQGMIHHHEGALAMARAHQQHEFESGRRAYGIDVLVDEILVAQRAEITKMKNWLVQWQR
jgi:uncharacterized protein (DUF305 family)